MRSIATVRLDKARPALILTRESKRHLLAWVTVAPITAAVRGVTSEVPVGPRNGLTRRLRSVGKTAAKRIRDGGKKPRH